MLTYALPLCLVLLFALQHQEALAADADAWKSQIIYFLITDRFSPSPGVAPSTACKPTDWNNGASGYVCNEVSYSSRYILYETYNHCECIQQGVSYNLKPANSLCWSYASLSVSLYSRTPCIRATKRQTQQVCSATAPGSLSNACVHMCLHLAGSWSGITSKLDYIKDLGMTAVSSGRSSRTSERQYNSTASSTCT